MVDPRSSPEEAERSVEDLASEREFVAALRRGESRAFERLIREHGAALRSTARRLLLHADDADEVLQEAFLSAFRAVERFEERASLKTWLHRIVVRAALMRLRSRRSRDEREWTEAREDAEFSPHGYFLDVPDPWSRTALDQLGREEERRLVRRTVDELPEALRTVVVLRDIEQWSYEEIGAELGVSANAVKVRVHRGRQRLRSMLSPHFAEREARSP